MRNWKILGRYLLYIFLIFAFLGCDDSVMESPPSGDVNDPTKPGEPEDEQPSDKPVPIEPDDKPDPTDDQPTQPEREYSMLLIGMPPTEVDVNVVGKITLEVLLYSIDTAEPAVNEKINWEILSGAEFIKISSANTRTDENGQASNQFEAVGKVGDVVIKVSHSKSKSVTYTIHVVPLPTGDIKAISSYTGMAPVEHYSVELYDYDDLSCAEILYDWKPEGVEYLEKIDNNQALFEDLLLDKSYTLVSYGFSNNGALVAFGCVDSHIVTEADKVISYSVVMDTIPLNPVTTYHVRSYFDFGDIISKFGSAGQWISKIVTGMNNPGKLLYDVLIDDLLLDTGCSSILPGFLCSAASWLLDSFGLDDKLSDYLTGLITKNETGCDVIEFVCQLRSIVQTFELLGNLSVEASGGDVNFVGTNSYSGLSFYWRTGCVSNKTDPNYDPNCGRTALEDGKLNALGVISGTWNGVVSNYDSLAIQNHNLQMNYGKLIYAIVMNYLLPKVAGGATDFTNAIAYWFKCRSVANWLSNTIKLPGWLGGYGVSFEQGLKWCNSAAGILDNVLNFSSMLLQVQKTNSDLYISGNVSLRDSSGDNVVDVMENGTWTGSISVEGKQSVVNGLWSAYNRENGDYCTYPKSASDAASQKCAFPAIDITSIIHSGACGTCSAN